MAATPSPHNNQPDVWPILVWVGQNAWFIMAGICAWLVNILYQVLIAKRNEYIDQRLDAMSTALIEIKEELAEIRGELRGRKK